jgi:hypothetical protein
VNKEEILARLEERLEEEREIQRQARQSLDTDAHKVSRIKQRDIEWFRALVEGTPE